MIHLALNITNPWSKQNLSSVKFWHGPTPWKNKFWELDLTRSRTIVSANLVVSHRQSHSGFEVMLGLFGYDLMFTIYDQRHWDYDINDWEKSDDKENLL
jgi:hypothetical protein